MRIKPSKARLTITAKPEVKAQLERLAQREGRSSSKQIAHLIQTEFQRVFGLDRDEMGGVAEVDATGTSKETRARFRPRNQPGGERFGTHRPPNQPSRQLAISSLLTTREAAAILALKEPHLRKLVRAGLIPVVRINARVIRFSEDALLKWMSLKSR